MGERTKNGVLVFFEHPVKSIFKHLACTQQQPFWIYSIFFHKWVQPRNLKPTPIQIFAVGYKIAPVYFVQAAIGVYTSYLFHRHYCIQSAIETFHYLFAYWCIHFSLFNSTTSLSMRLCVSDCAILSER